MATCRFILPDGSDLKLSLAEKQTTAAILKEIRNFRPDITSDWLQLEQNGILLSSEKSVSEFAASSGSQEFHIRPIAHAAHGKITAAAMEAYDTFSNTLLRLAASLPQIDAIRSKTPSPSSLDA